MSDSQTNPDTAPHQKLAPNRCRTVLLDDTPAKEDEFGSHDRVSASIADLVLNEEGGHAIALVGSWGSGKSTVVRLLQARLHSSSTDARCFVFDAWRHSGDCLRRSFLESLVFFLRDAKWVAPTAWQTTLDELSGRREHVRQVTRPHLTCAGVIVVLAALGVPVGYSKIDVWRSPQGTIDDLLDGVLLIFLPAIMGLSVWGLNRAGNWLARQFPRLAAWWPLRSCCGRPTTSPLGLIVNRTAETVTTESIRSPEPTSVEFERSFSEILKSVLAANSRRLVIVMDNLDRVSVPEALDIWRTMQAFLDFPCSRVTGCAKNRLWLLVPFDEHTPEKLWDGASEGESTPTTNDNKDLASAFADDNKDLASAFVDKTFQTVFRTPPPVLADRRTYLLRLLKTAFPDHATADADGLIKVFRIYDLLRGGEPVPRSMKLFVNKLGAYHRIWLDEIPLSDQAAFVLATAGRDDVPRAIIGSTLLDKRVAAHVTPDWQKSFAALYYGIPRDAAYHMLLDDKLREHLGGGNAEEIAALAQNVRGFEDVCDRFLDRNLRQWVVESPEYIASASLALHFDSKPLESWRQRSLASLVQAAQDVSDWGTLSRTSTDGLLELVRECYAEKRVCLASALVRALGNHNPTEPGNDLDDWVTASATLLAGLVDAGVPAGSLRTFGIRGESATAIQVLQKLQSSGVREVVARLYVSDAMAARVVKETTDRTKTGKFDTSCEAAVILLDRLAILPDASALLAAAVHRLNTELKTSVGETTVLISTALRLCRFNTESPSSLAEALTSICKEGAILNHFQNSHEAKAWKAAALCVLAQMLAEPNGQLQNYRGQSQNGQQKYQQMRNGPEQYREVVAELVQAAADLHVLPRLLEQSRKTDAAKTIKLSTSLLRSALAFQHTLETLPASALLNNFDLLYPDLQEEVRTFLQNHKSKDEVLDELAALPFTVPAVRLHLDAYERCNGGSHPGYQRFLVAGLSGVQKASWTEELAKQTPLLELLRRMLDDGCEPALGASLADAMHEQWQMHLAKPVIAPEREDRWSRLLGGLATHVRETLLKNLRDELLGTADKPVHRAARLLGAELARLMQDDASACDKLVRTLAPKILDRMQADEINWLADFLRGEPRVWENAQESSRKDLTDRVRAAAGKSKDDSTRAALASLLRVVDPTVAQNDPAEVQNAAQTSEP